MKNKREIKPLYPPCAIGDTVYGYWAGDETDEAFIEELEVRALTYDGVPLEIGVEVVLTREEAEAAIHGF